MATQKEQDTPGTAPTRGIVGCVTHNGNRYVRGQEDALTAVLPQSDINRLVDKGVLAGDWTMPRSLGDRMPIVTRIDGRPDVVGDDGLIHGDPAQSPPGVVLAENDGSPNVSGVAAAPAKKAAKKKTARKSTHTRGS